MTRLFYVAYEIDNAVRNCFTMTEREVRYMGTGKSVASWWIHHLISTVVDGQNEMKECDRIPFENTVFFFVGTTGGEDGVHHTDFATMKRLDGVSFTAKDMWAALTSSDPSPDVIESCVLLRRFYKVYDAERD